MKVAILSESSADEAAIRVLVDAILARPTQSVAISLRSRGWPSVRNVLAPVIRDLFYATDAEALVVVVDANGSLPHDTAHDSNISFATACRICQLSTLVSKTVATLRPMPNRSPFKIALGCAAPAIEAWLCYGSKSGVGEAMWNIELRERPAKAKSIKEDLKRAVYGTDRPSLELERTCMVRQMQRLIQDLDLLGKAFPSGFGMLFNEIRSWR